MPLPEQKTSLVAELSLGGSLIGMSHQRVFNSSFWICNFLIEEAQCDRQVILEQHTDYVENCKTF